MLGETLLLPRTDVPTKIPTRIQDSNYLLYKEPSKQTVLHITKLLFCVHHSDQFPDRLPFWEPFGSQHIDSGSRTKFVESRVSSVVKQASRMRGGKWNIFSKVITYFTRGHCDRIRMMVVAISGGI